MKLSVSIYPSEIDICGLGWHEASLIRGYKEIQNFSESSGQYLGQNLQVHIEEGDRSVRCTLQWVFIRFDQ